MQDIWIDFASQASGQAVQLHGLWLPQPEPGAPVLLYLHGARWDVRGSAHRMRRMHELGFAVLGVDYRGFGRSSPALPSEALAAEVDDEAGLLVEGSFPSIPDVVSSFRWGWLPLGPLITQRFDAGARIASVRSPVLVVHGGQDSLIQPALGQALFEKASEPKRFVLVPGGSHHNTNALGQPQYREALAQLFGLDTLRRD